MRSTLLALLLLVPCLAGCSDDGATPDDPDPAAADPAGLAVPAWAIGDYWVYETTFGDWTLVVSEDAGADWIVDTADPNLSFFSGAFGEISYLGAIRKSDLAGSQEGQRVQFMSFPLTDGKTWRTTWDQEEVTMVATRVSDDRYEIVGSVGDAVRKEVVYDNATRWFESVVFYGDDGEEFGRMTVREAGHGWTGDVVRVTPELIDEQSFTGAAVPYISTYSFSNAADADAYLIYSAACQTGTFAFALGTVQSTTNIAADVGVFEDQGFSSVAEPCPRTQQVQAVIGDAPEIDNWGVVFTSASPDVQLDFSFWLRHMEHITL